MHLSNFCIPANLNLTATNCSNVPFSTQRNDMAELTWENGRLSVNGFGSGLTSAAAAVGTLESIVNLATHKQQPPPGNFDYDDINVPCRSTQYQEQRSSPGGGGSSAAASLTDALVPCETTPNEERQVIAMCDVSGSARGKKPRPRRNLTRSDLGGSVSRHVPTVDTCEKDSCGFGVATASFSSLASTRNTTSVDDHDDSAACLTRSQEDTCEKKKGIAARSSLLTKRSRAAAVHNQSERKRRETINEKMKILKKMIPNSSKTDKSSMLDEVIEYLKQLQAQVQMMMISTMSIPSMIMPFAMPQHPFHMPMIPPMGIAMNMNMNMAHQNLANLTAPLTNPNAPFTPMVTAPWDAATANQLSPSSVHISSGDPSSFLARSQPQSMSMEAYARMVAMMQQQQQQLDADKT